MIGLLVAAALFAQTAQTPQNNRTPSFKVQGRVLHTGNPILLGAGVNIELLGGEVTVTSTISPDGSFQFQNVPPGAYGASIPGAQILLGDGVTVTDRDVSGMELVVVLGSAYIRMSEPSAVRLDVQNNSTGVPLQAEPNDNGRFEFVGLPGTYQVTMVSPSAIPLPVFAVTIPPLRPIVLEVAAPQLHPVKIHTTVEGAGPGAGSESPPPFTLRINGTIAAGRLNRPPSQGTTQFTIPESKLTSAVVEIVPGRDGAFDIFLPEGRYEIAAELPEASSRQFRVKSTNGFVAVTEQGGLEMRVVLVRQ